MDPNAHDKTVRNALGPLKACLATARREGLIRHNPATDIALPHRARMDDDEERPRPFPRVESDGGEAVETTARAALSSGCRRICVRRFRGRGDTRCPTSTG